MNYHIRNLHGTELPVPLCYQLQPFVNSYKPHDKPPTKEDMDQDDYIPKESPLSKENIIDTYKALKYEQDLEWLKLKREYNKKWSGYRTWYNL